MVEPIFSWFSQAGRGVYGNVCTFHPKMQPLNGISLMNLVSAHENQILLCLFIELLLVTEKKNSYFDWIYIFILYYNVTETATGFPLSFLDEIVLVLTRIG